MKPNPNVLSKRLGEEMVLFNLDTDHFYELNGSAARFWELLNAGSDDAAVRQQMLVEFEVDRFQSRFVFELWLTADAFRLGKDGPEVRAQNIAGRKSRTRRIELDHGVFPRVHTLPAFLCRLRASADWPSQQKQTGDDEP